MLGAHDVRYLRRIAIKGQVLADFVAEFTESVTWEGKGIVNTMTVLAFVAPTWEVYADGEAN